MPALNLPKTLLWRETLMAKTAPGSLTGRDFYHLIFFSLYWCQLEKQKFLKFKKLALDKRKLKPEPYKAASASQQWYFPQIICTRIDGNNHFLSPFPASHCQGQLWGSSVRSAASQVVGYHSQWSESHVQRISSDPHFKALRGTYLHPTIPHILSLGIWLISLVLSLSLLPEHLWS